MNRNRLRRDERTSHPLPGGRLDLQSPFYESGRLGTRKQALTQNVRPPHFCHSEFLGHLIGLTFGSTPPHCARGDLRGNRAEALSEPVMPA
jgi:hypothetical protein